MNETPSDVQPKKDPKVFTLEQAIKAVQPKVEALLKEAITGFEVSDKDGFKRLFGAFAHAGMETVLTSAKEAGVTNVKAHSLARRAAYAANDLHDKFTPSSPPKLEAIDGGAEDEEIEDDDEGDENDDD